MNYTECKNCKHCITAWLEDGDYTYACIKKGKYLSEINSCDKKDKED